MTLLEIEDLSVNYGHIEAIRDISFGVEEGNEDDDDDDDGKDE